MLLPEAIVTKQQQQQKSPEVCIRYFHMKYGHIVPESLKTIQGIAISLVCPLELGLKTLSIKIPHGLAAVHKSHWN